METDHSALEYNLLTMKQYSVRVIFCLISPEIMYHLDNPAPHDLCPVATFSVNAGSR